VLNELDKEISTAAVGRHYGVNESTICYIEENEDVVSRGIKGSAAQGTNFLCAIMSSSSKRWRGPCVFVWKMRHRNGC
jgi:hypothetical protein